MSFDGKPWQSPVLLGANEYNSRSPMTADTLFASQVNAYAACRRKAVLAQFNWGSDRVHLPATPGYTGIDFPVFQGGSGAWETQCVGDAYVPEHATHIACDMTGYAWWVQSPTVLYGRVSAFDGTTTALSSEQDVVMDVTPEGQAASVITMRISVPLSTLTLGAYVYFYLELKFGAAAQLSFNDVTFLSEARD